MKNNNIKPIALIILDGWGYREEGENNAIFEAKTPFFDQLWSEYPHSLLEASGLAVGLPEGQMGNSEVGHTTIGAGKTVYTDLVRINLAVQNQEFDTNETLQKLFAHSLKNDSTLHLIGLIGPGGVHAHSEHLFEIIRSAKRAGLKKVAIHAFTDGRDTPPQSAVDYLIELEKVISEVGIGFISTMTGRYFAMDRDNNWDRLAKAEETIFEGKGMNVGYQKPSDVAKTFYNKGKTDEHFEPVVFLNEKGGVENIKENDSVFFFNFRADRARMLSEKIIKYTTVHFGLFGTMTSYSKDLDCLVAFQPTEIETTLAAEISKAGLSQVHIAETEKFAHATYFLNGGREEPHNNEKHILVPSRKDIATHDLAPEMMAEEIANKAIEEINNDQDFIFINFANADMVGHTANKEAIIRGLEKVDNELGRVIRVIQDKNGIALVTADHGNAEVSIDKETGEKHTSHTINPVPFILTIKDQKVKNGNLADITPTILELFNITKPESMSGVSLLD
jgi:2,3-bisphosphoglycerate-independent phosphoglycerate mutase